MSDFYTSKEKKILNYLEKQDLSKKYYNHSSVTFHITLKFNQLKIDDTWFEMNKIELISFLKKRGNNDFLMLDRDLINAGINIEENFYVNFS